jgi:hypothetical protein
MDLSSRPLSNDGKPPQVSDLSAPPADAPLTGPVLPSQRILGDWLTDVRDLLFVPGRGNRRHSEANGVSVDLPAGLMVVDPSDPRGGGDRRRRAPALPIR